MVRFLAHLVVRQNINQKGQSSYLECPGAGKIGDRKRSGYMSDPSIAKLRVSTFIEDLGIALYASFSISALFVHLVQRSHGGILMVYVPKMVPRYPFKI